MNFRTISCLIFCSTLLFCPLAFADGAKKDKPSLPEAGEDSIVDPCKGLTIQDLAGKVASQKHDGVRFHFNPNKLSYDASREVWYEAQSGSTWTCQLNSNAKPGASLVTDFNAKRSGAGYGDTGGMVNYGDTFMDGVGGNSCYTCGLIRWYKGCFPPGVKVTLGNGEGERLVEDVAAGDLLWNPVRGENVKVLKVIEGGEALPLIEVFAGNLSLKVSQGHPMYTAQGFKKAKQLSIGDVLFDAHGNAHQVDKIKTLPVVEGQTVINFILEDDGQENSRLLLADGIVVSDFVTQNVLAASN